jgi:hypothetical protein
LAQSKEEAKNEEEKKDGANASNVTKIDPKLKRKATVANIWKMGAEGFGHNEDPLPFCPPPEPVEEGKEEVKVEEGKN